MNLVKALRLRSDSRIAFVGAGGKTSAIFQLAHAANRPVLVTTTTHLAVEQAKLSDRHIIFDEKYTALGGELGPGVTLVTGPPGQDGRLGGLPHAAIDALHLWASEMGVSLLVEADGAGERSLKAPAGHEPVIPSIATDVVVVAGLSALGQPLSGDLVHRPEIFARLSGRSIGETITLEAIAEVLLHDQGGLKDIPAHSRPIALLNHISTPDLASEAQRLAGKLLPRFHAVLSADLPHYSDTHAGSIHTAYEPTAAIILAAGDSKRFGRPKQLLDWRGKSFVRHIAETALDAGIDPVVAVTGANGEQVGAALDGMGVEMVHNPEWKAGQSTSIQAGLAVLPPSTGAVLFLLSDQPQVPATLLRALAAQHAETLAPIIAPQIDGRRGNPVLFDRATFPDFVQLSGDVGGRALFSRYKVEWMPWLDDTLLLDVDTPEDYQKLLDTSR